jgi:hypothetical protein
MKKNTVIILIFFTLIISYFIVSKLMSASHEGLVKNIRDNVPESIKKILKDTIFTIPTLKKKISKSENQISKLEKKSNEQGLLIDGILNKLNSNNFHQNKILLSEKNLKYELTKILLPFYDLENVYLNKKQGYLEVINDQLYFFFWSGKIITVNLYELLNNKVTHDKFKVIENNINEFIYNHRFKWIGIKDSIFYDGFIYISYTKEVKNNCFSLGVLKAPLNQNNSEFLKFEEMTSFDECVSIDNSDNFSNKKYFGGYQAGGRMEIYDNHLLLTIGDYRTWKLPQKNNSIFGKILSINLQNKEIKTLSKGHRNPQGLLLYKKDYLFSSEHGPKGGDEINLLLSKNFEKNNNYGWPLASYGNHYASVSENYELKKIAPLNKSHSDYGFIEPLEFFTPAIGPSQLIENKFDKERIFITSLKAKKILDYTFNISDLELKLEDVISVDERIRDITFDQNTNTYFLFLEDSPAVGILKKIK